MNKVQKKFIKAGFSHELVKRTGVVAIYKRQHPRTPHPHYEIVKISKHNGYKMGGQYIEAAETYPGASLWGLQGWTVADLGRAEVYFKKACKRFNKRALSSVG